ncbi:hypothetical protein [Hyphomicrobium sp. LHD-15]|uniref:hypothetical protein n=1 Tax=Hyphomicrobium sp. LHD-15 TaxID=3072142 RepID=UPI00280D09DB|nr:hypothetical protein [Hyphomicrobium sp. LHD-15]MDQ8700551.1 hypothetical protein [Hyphomicrobium sp. LHD-15]
MDLRELSDDGFVFYFAGKRSDIDVDTLGDTLSALAEALRRINEVVDPEFELEITIEATSGGSFFANVRIRKLAKSPLARIAGHLLLAMLSAYLYDLATYKKPVFRLEGDEFVIVTDQEVIKLPIAVLENQERIARKPEIAKSIKQAFEAVEDNEEVNGVAIIPITPEARPLIVLPRHEFKTIIHNAGRIIEGSRTPFQLTPRRTFTRTTTERVSLVIVKAVLRRSRRKWQFTWNGTDISAPITDAPFFDRLESREISISQGDALDVDLAVTQSLDEDSQAWSNVEFVVTLVHGLIQMPRQQNLGL